MTRVLTAATSRRNKDKGYTGPGYDFVDVALGKSGLVGIHGRGNAKGIPNHPNHPGTRELRSHIAEYSWNGCRGMVSSMRRLV